VGSILIYIFRRQSIIQLLIARRKIENHG